MKTLLLFIVAALIQTTAFASLTTVVQNDEKENLLADFSGRTLYTFDLDKGTNSSKCNQDCSEIWPPYLINDQEAKALQAPLAVIKRTNGMLQLTYNGQPIYIYAFDRVAGDDQGDGLGNVWHYVEIK